MQGPRWDGYCADPFIFSAQGRYFAVGTGRGGGTFLEAAPREGGGIVPGERAIPILSSDDLAHWRYLGGALRPLLREGPVAYWAPEVVEREGRYHLFYSVGGPEGESHHIRLALSRSPEGPYEDSGKIFFASEPFCIDAHPFCDPKDGRWYLFFAKDFFDEPAGTGIAVCELRSDLGGTEGEAVTVARATDEWMLFAKNRNWYGKVWPKWYTVEGPAVLVRDGKYYCFYSGGNWHGTGYGITYAVAPNVMGPYTPTTGPASVLRTSESMKGPGHCSFFRSRGSEETMAAFHAWNVDESARQMWIGRLVWEGGGPRILME